MSWIKIVASVILSILILLCILSPWLLDLLDFFKVPVTTGMAKIDRKEETRKNCVMYLSVGNAWGGTLVKKEIFDQTVIDGEIKISFQKPRYGRRLRIKEVIGL